MAGRSSRNIFAALVATLKSQKPLAFFWLLPRFERTFDAGRSDGHLIFVRAAAISLYFSGLDFSFLEYPNQVSTSAAVIVREPTVRGISNAFTYGPLGSSASIGALKV